MAASMIGPKFYGWDRNGKPLAFGKLYTYQARTNNPKPTYQSEDQVVENTNPVILNGEGYANIYLSGSYKMVLKDSKDNEIWTSDPVTEAGSGGFTYTLTALYNTSNKVSVNGDHYNAFPIGASVTLKFNDTGNDEVSTVKNVFLSSGVTTIEIEDPVVRTSIVQISTSNGFSVISEYDEKLKQYTLRDVGDYNQNPTINKYYEFVNYNGSPFFSITVPYQVNSALYPDPSLDPNLRLGYATSESLVTSQGTTQPRALKDRFADFINVKDFGAGLSGDDTQAFNDAALLAKETGKKLVADGSFNLNGIVTVYTECDLSSAKITMNNAKIIIADDRIDYSTTLTEQDIDKSLMSELSDSFDNVIADPVLLEYKDALYFVESSSVYIYRNNGGSWSAQNKSSVGALKKFGKLQYTLSTDFTSANDVTIKLFKNHPKKLRFIGGEFVLNSVSSPIIECTRSNVVISDVTMTRGSYSVISGSSGISLRNCMNVDVLRLNSEGIGNSNTDSDDASVDAYDIVMNATCNIDIERVIGNTSWRTIDGNYSRGITVDNSVLSSMHAHFNCADITVKDTVLTNRGFSFATGAPDSNIHLIRCGYTGGDYGFCGVRSDYGELRGNLHIKDCYDKSTYFESTIISLKEDAIFDSGGSNPIQPGVYSMPNIYVDGFEFSGDNGINVVAFNGLNAITERVYDSGKQLSFPEVVSLKNINLNKGEYDGIRYHELVIPYNYDSVTYKRIIKDVRNGVLVLSNTVGGEKAKNESTRFEFTITDCKVSTGILGSTYVSGSPDSILSMYDAVIVDIVLMFNGTNGSFLGACAIDNVLFDMNSSTVTNFGGYRSVTNCTFDATRRFVSQGVVLSADILSHISSGNVAINFHLDDDTYAPEKGKTAYSGTRGVVNGDGGMDVYTKDPNTGVVTPTWDTQDERITGTFASPTSIKVKDGYVIEVLTS